MMPQRSNGHPVPERNESLEAGIAFQAQGQAAEALAAVRSNERLTTLQFVNVDKTITSMKEDVEYGFAELKNMIQKQNDTMERGFRNYDQKFWSLAIAMITILLTICGFLIAYTVFPGAHHG